jgi:nucleoid-associated protein YgaU
MKKLDGPVKALLVAVVLAVATGCATAPKEEPEPTAAAPEIMPEPEPAPAAPEPEAAPTPEPAAEPMLEEVAEMTYTVVRGDNLWNIAGSRAIYGNPYQWPLIYKANSHQIDDADLIYPDQVLMIPDAEAAEIEAAIQHARTRGAWSLGVIEQSDLAYLRQ